MSDLQVIWLLEQLTGRTSHDGIVWECLGVFSSPELAQRIVANEHRSGDVSEWQQKHNLMTHNEQAYFEARAVLVTGGWVAYRIVPLGLDEMYLDRFPRAESV